MTKRQQTAANGRWAHRPLVGQGNRAGEGRP